ncbi:MAG: hypothetical protein HYW05_03385 [Candidatus Diapherotrites archaeon]|nr:hypothetical protein [Candidatus Diapherotrites archaeon]
MQKKVRMKKTGMNYASEFKRQIIHLLFGLIAIAIVLLIGALNSLFVFAGIFFIGLVISDLVKRGVNVPFLHEIVKHVQREHERHLPGKAALVLALAIVVLLALNVIYFQNEKIVLGALIVLAIGDSVAPIVGIRFGKLKIGKRSVEGTIAGIIASFLVLSLLFAPQTAFIAATFGMLAEFLPADDNFAIPLISAVALKLLI